MKTNRFFLVMLAAAGIMTACSNDEAVQTSNNGKEISFRMQGSAPALKTTATTNENIDAFVVFGTDNEFDPTLIFEGVTVSRDIIATTNPLTPVFTYAPKKYYDAAATDAVFFAYSPASAKVIAPASFLPSFVSGTTTFEYVVPKPDNSGKVTQEDLLVAVTPTSSLTTPVVLGFKHALSRIFVTATNTMGDPVIIERLILKNLVKSGELVIDPASPAPCWTWNPSGVLDDYEYELAESGVAVPAAAIIGTPSPKKLVTSNEQGMMVLPQITVNDNDDTTFDAGDFALEVRYKVGNLVGQQKFILIEDQYPFEFNKQYRINIEFSERVIDFTISVADFDAHVEVDYP